MHPSSHTVHDRNHNFTFPSSADHLTHSSTCTCGVAVKTVTAGKYKRQLTPTKKTTPEDVEKTKQDLEDVLALFKSYVARFRPQLNIEEVATGEVWFGPDALNKNLCDELKTLDDVLLEAVADGSEVYSVRTRNPAEESLSSLVGSGILNEKQFPPSLIQRLVLKMAKTFLGDEGLAELGEGRNGFQLPSKAMLRSTAHESLLMKMDDDGDF